MCVCVCLCVVCVVVCVCVCVCVCVFASHFGLIMGVCCFTQETMAELTATVRQVVAVVGA